MKNTYQNVAEAIGFTPMIKLNRIPEKEGIKCQLFAKCEFNGIGGSSKDRIGRSMIEGAEARGEIKKGDYVIESTSGNTGIGLTITSIAKGYKSVVTIPDKMSTEKINLLKAMGAEVVICDTSAPSGHPNK